MFFASNAETRALRIAIPLSGGVTVELEELFQVAGVGDVEKKSLRAGLVRETLGSVGEGSFVIDLDERRGEVEGVFEHYPPTATGLNTRESLFERKSYDEMVAMWHGEKQEY